MKKQKLSIILIALFLPIFNISAQVLENIPGQNSVGGSNLIGYLNNLYKFGISITGILAVFMIALGAFSYIITSAGNTSKMMNAKEMINNALIGLVIVLTAYLFLYVINPDLVGGTLRTPREAVNNVISSNSSTGNSNTGTLADGTACNDGSVSPACPTCPHCATCANGYHTDVSGNQVCGQSPSAVASPTTVGCCVWNSNSECDTAKTKTECEDTLGGNFTVGTGLICKDTVFLGTWYQCQ